ncbi:MAG: BamA/TamA family outer membrane protein [Cystobacterineae bacterium]|nr:BamA/TamA family outer membrane protein [Cystobacterineae bacterium]
MALLTTLLLCTSPSKEVENVELRLMEGEVSELEGLDALVSVRKGQQLSPKAVRQSLLRLFETGRFADVAVFSTPGQEGLLLRFDLWAKRKLTRLVVVGNTRLSNADIASASGLIAGSELSNETIFLARERLKERYQKLGYPQAQISVSASVQPGGTEAIIELSEGAPLYIRQITFEGQFPFEENFLKQKMDLREGKVFNLEQVAEDEQKLRDFFVKEGYWQVQLTRLEKAEEVLCFSIVLGPKWRLVFRGNQQTSDRLLGKLVHSGSTLTLNRWELERIQQKLADFYRFRGYPEVRIRHAQFFSADKSHASLAFFIEEGRQLLVRHIVFRGNERLADDELIHIIVDMMNAAASTTSVLDDSMVDPLMLQGSSPKAQKWSHVPRAEQVFVEEVWPQTAAGMTSLYRERGFLHANVILSKTQWDDEGIVVYFDIHEGPQFRFRKLSMEGFPEGRRQQKRSLKLMPDMVVSESHIESERQRLLAELMDDGYWFASIQSQLKKDEEGNVDLAFSATPGPQVRLGKVVFRGLEKTQLTTANSQVFLVEEQVVNPRALLALQRRLSALGTFRFVEVRLMEPDVQAAQKDVLVELKERPMLSWESSFGYFMADGPRLVFDFAYPNIGGLALALAGRLAVNYYAASAPALLGQVDIEDLSGFELLGGRVNLSLQNRSLLPNNIGFRVDLAAERVFRPSYHFMRVALGPGVDWTRHLRVPWAFGIWPELTFLLQWETEYSSVKKLPYQGQNIQHLLRSDVERLRFLDGIFVLSVLRASTILDARDNPIFPKKGFLTQASLDWVSDLYAKDEKGSPVVVQFLKLSGNLSFYIPVQKNVLAFSLRGGKIFPLNKGISPPVKRFYLGGATSLRGFSEDGLLAADFRQSYREEVYKCKGVISQTGCSDTARSFLRGEKFFSQGGEFFLLLKAELRVPLFEKLELGVFAEAGNLWLETPKFPFALRPVAGFGLRYGTPVGPLAVDLGFNLNPDSLLNESLLNFYFSIGVF